MAINKPYHRNWRPFTSGGCSQYILHPKYAKSPTHYVRAFLLIQKDLQQLFDYIEPSDLNLKCFSFRIHELLLRACIETEANFRAVLQENDYEKKSEKGEPIDLNIDDYKKLEYTHKLSSYRINIPHWIGSKSTRVPFSSWSRPEQHSPSWYQAYNKTKHSRQEEFHHANFQNLIDAVCGLLALLSAQFFTNDFTSADGLILAGGYGPQDGMETAIGNYFRIKFPDNWSNEERYDFDSSKWDAMANHDDPFQKIDFSTF